MPSLPKIKTFIFLLLFCVLLLGIWSTVTHVRKGGEVSQEKGEPGKETVTGELVENFPELPVYAEATLLDSYKKQEGDKEGFEANWEVTASVAEVMRWYISAFRQSGWTFKEEPVVNETSEQYIIAGKNSSEVVLTVEREEGTTVINAEFPLR